MRIEIRNDSVVISGYVTAVERESRVMNSPQGKFVEVVRSKTFQRALESAINVDVLLNHSKKLGSTTEKTLMLTEDNIGLRAIATITDAETVKKAKANELVGWSFGFQKNKDSWQDGENGVQKRFLEDINLLEVSILDNTKTPAYIGTSIESRENESILIENRTIEDNIELVDNSTKKEEKREQTIDYSLIENDLKTWKA